MSSNIPNLVPFDRVKDTFFKRNDLIIYKNNKVFFGKN